MFLINCPLLKHSDNNNSEMKTKIVNNVTYTKEYDIRQQFNDYLTTRDKNVHVTITDTSKNDVFPNNLSDPQSTNPFNFFFQVSVKEIEN